MEESLVTDPFSAFSEDVRPDVDGLIWLGYLEDAFSYCGHQFVIRTLRGDEELMGAYVVKEYTETLGQAKAHVWATIGLAIVSVDGSEEFCPPVSPNKRDFARARFNWVSSNWLWPLALHIYNHYTALLQRQQDALDALEDFYQGSLPQDTPFADSSIDRASFQEPEEDIRDYLQEGDSIPSS